MAGLVDGRCLRSVSPLNDVGRRRVYSHARDRSSPEGEESLAFSLAEGVVMGGTWRMEDLPTNLPALCHRNVPIVLWHTGWSLSSGKDLSCNTPNRALSDDPHQIPILLSSAALHDIWQWMPASQPATTRHAYDGVRLSYSNYAHS